MKSNHLTFFPQLLLVILLSGILFASCSPTKHVPDGAYLLNKVEVKSDAKEINKNDLPEYIRQTPNSYILGLFRLQLGIYNLTGKDTTKWFNRTLRRIGQEPVILDSMLTDISSRQLLNFHMNKGYYDAKINTVVNKKNKKARVSYQVQSNTPYLINSYRVDVPFHELENLSRDSAHSLVQPNMLFDVYQLDSERERLTSRMRRQGYYNFMKDYLAYTADSVGHKVDVTLQLRDYLMENKDTLNHTIFRQYHISKVIFNLSPAVSTIITEDHPARIDTIPTGGYVIITPEDKFLTFSALVSSTFIKPGTLYSDADVEKTYAALNALPPVKYTHISFSETAPDSLQCLITIAESKSFTFTSQAEITFTEGYWGTAGNLGVVHRNLFKGAESLTLQGRLALERQENVIAQEWGGQIGIRVPRTIIPFIDDSYSRSLQGSTEFRGTFNFQFRPGEFSSTNVGGGVKYNWLKGRQNYALDLLDLSYVYFPWISQQFRDNFLVTGKYNRYNYDDYLIMRLSYSTAFSGYSSARPMRNYFTYRYGVESAGNALFGIYKLLNIPSDAEGFYRAFNIRYSQYVRGEINASFHQIIDKNNKFVYHAGVGAGIPYGNAEIMPFERRFYSGGANSVRGWGESQLGPGTYQRFSTLRRRDYNQVGDIKLDVNFEYRTKMFWVLEGAFFADAGNVWTIREYDNQPGGAFRLDSFWKQIALAYGIGIRMDFNFFLFRIDMGVKLHDPAVVSTPKWVLPSSFKDIAFHIAIGYPF
ncbi:MAG: BamA/TamA family outer membrane protein [Paludibacter sp.]|nr:BamA/TamA family outer membrane protein [Paludibacter sp.]MDD4198809.1 BamA/TamA family outer membrane protein [Paludibacter sp.]MDD4428767.1 BamA/TamA family outer membrane protein [Paludibacter sp.]